MHFRHFHPFRFENTSDLYFICLLKYNGLCSGGKEFIRQEQEIADIKWMEIEQALSLQSMSGVTTTGERDRIQEKVNLMVEHWDDENVDLGLMYPTKTRKDREYFVFGPNAKCVLDIGHISEH